MKCFIFKYSKVKPENTISVNFGVWERQTETEKETERDRETGRQTETETELHMSSDWTIAPVSSWRTF